MWLCLGLNFLYQGYKHCKFWLRRRSWVDFKKKKRDKVKNGNKKAANNQKDRKMFNKSQASISKSTSTKT